MIFLGAGNSDSLARIILERINIDKALRFDNDNDDHHQIKALEKRGHKPNFEHGSLDTKALKEDLYKEHREHPSTDSTILNRLLRLDELWGLLGACQQPGAETHDYEEWWKEFEEKRDSLINALLDDFATVKYFVDDEGDILEIKNCGAFWHSQYLTNVWGAQYLAKDNEYCKGEWPDKKEISKEEALRRVDLWEENMAKLEEDPETTELNNYGD